MNTTNRFTPGSDGAFVKLTLMALCAMGLMAAIAAQQPVSADDVHAAKASSADSRSAQVSLAGLDLSTAEGMLGARLRVHQAARRLCAQVEDLDDLSRGANFAACVEASTVAALQQIKPPSLAAVAKEPRRDRP